MHYSSTFVSGFDEVQLYVRRYERQHSPVTCLLIHGSGEGGYVWGRTCNELESSYSLVVVDLRGHGDSQRSLNGRYELSTYTRDVSRVIQSLQLKRVVMIGHSLGGLITMHLAAGPLGNRIAGTIIVDSVPESRPEAERQARENLAASLRLWKSVESYQEHLGRIQPMLSDLIAKEHAAAALQRSKGGFQLKVDPAVVNEGRDEAAQPDVLEALLPSIACPTLLVRGAGSAAVSAASARKALNLLRKGQLAVIQRAGHAVMSDNAPDFVGAVTSFIETVVRPSLDRPASASKGITHYSY